MNKKRVKNTILFALYNIFVVLIILVILEVTVAYLYKHPASIPNFATKSFQNYYSQVARSTIQVEPSCARYDPALFYLLKTGKCTFSNIEFNTEILVNSKGLRDTEESLNKPEIIFLGDSFTMGWGVNQDEAFPQQAGMASGKKILNAGMSSFGTAREVSLLNSLDMDSVKTLVIQYHTNDLHENEEYLANNHSLTISSKNFYDSMCETNARQRKYFPGKHLANVGRFMLKDALQAMPPDERDVKKEARIFLEILSEKNIDPAVNIVVFEIASRNNNSNDFTNALEGQAKNYPNLAERLKIIHLANAFSQEDYFILDDHLNTQGHKKLAQLLLPYL